jgi:hypothetical protein
MLRGDFMAISKRARARIKLASKTEATAMKKATKLLYESELMGIKRMREIMRALDKVC